MASRGLGKGIDALLPSSINISKLVEGVDIVNLPIDEVGPNPEQPRRTMSEEALAELSESIKSHGVLQPIIVVKQANGHMIIAGERRWRAAKAAKLATIPCIVRSLSGVEQLQVALIENLQREDINPIEQAQSIQRLHEDFNLHYRDVAKSLGRSYPAVVNMVRLLKLPAIMQQSITDGEISEGHARALLALTHFPDEQTQMHTLIIKDNWSVRRAEQHVKDVREQPESLHVATKRRSNFVTDDWTNSLSTRLGAKVQINPTALGGFIKINYKTEEQLEEIKKLLNDQDQG